MTTRSSGRAGLVHLGVLALCLGLAACTSDRETEQDETAPVVQLGAPGESGTTLSPEEVEGLEDPLHTAADVAFVQQMIPHHEQALEMTALVPERAGNPDLATIAERIEVSQVDEVQQLETWLTRRGEEVSGMHAGHGSDHEGMPGMATPRQLEQLAGARGSRFDRLFLQAMIRHHEGAIVMVETLLAGGQGGQESEAFQLASHIASDQAVEIAAMKRVLRQSERSTP